MRNLLRHIGLIPRKLICWVIDVYQMTLSPDHGPLKHLHPYGYCRHEPTCSAYSRQMISQRGIVIGGLLSMKRVLSCHPWKRVSDEKILKVLNQSSQASS